MDPTLKLLFALHQVENLTSLLEGNEYEQYFVQHLIPIKYEIVRQLSNIK